MKRCNRCCESLPHDLFVTVSGAIAPSCKPCRARRVRATGESFASYLASLPPDRREELTQVELEENRRREERLREMGRI